MARSARDDELSRIAAEDLGATSMDRTLRALTSEHRTRTVFAQRAKNLRGLPRRHGPAASLNLEGST